MIDWVVWLGVVFLSSHFSWNPLVNLITTFAKNKWSSENAIPFLFITVFVINTFILYILVSYTRYIWKGETLSQSNLQTPPPSAPPEQSQILLPTETVSQITPQRNAVTRQTSLPDYNTAVATGLSTELPPPEYETAIQSQRVHLE